MLSAMIRVLLLLCLSLRVASAAAPPNIVLILTDDLGWSDLGCYGSPWQNTPNLDKLAAAGIRFTHAYAAQPICSANRAALMTGRTPARLNLTDFIPGRPVLPSQKMIRPQITLDLPLAEQTLPERLKPAGYTSAIFGKWHLGGAGFGPVDQGFDHYYAGDANTTPSATEGGKGEYDLTAKAIAWIGQQPKDRPFLCYLAHNTPHIPLGAKPELEEQYNKAANPTYAAMMATLDDCTGQLLAALETSGRAGDTLVIFMSDNGGLSTVEGIRTPATSNAPLRGGKGCLYEGGTRVPCLMRWPGHLPAGKTEATPIIATDLLPTLVAFAGLPAAGDLDGIDLSTFLTTGKRPERDTLCWHYPHYSNQKGFPAGSIRHGDWKLIESYDDQHLELYNLRDDPSENQDLARTQPLLTGQLLTKLNDWKKSVNAQPMQGPNPDYDPQATWNLARPGPKGGIQLHAASAEVTGTILRYEPAPNKNTLGYWTRKEDQAAWDIQLPAPGRYKITVHQGCGPGNAGSLVHVIVGNTTLPFTVQETKGFQDFLPVDVGEADLPAGRTRLTLAPQTKTAAAVMDVRLVTLQIIN
jgi:arylsulfatase A